MTKQSLSTFDRIMQDKKRKARFDAEYQDLLLSELILAIMEEDHVSVRKLADASGIAPSIIQDIRSGKKDNLTLRTFLSIVSPLGYNLVLERPKTKNHAAKKLRLPIRKAQLANSTE